VYRVRGQVLSSYAGGIKAPPSRQVAINGTYRLRTELRGSKWVVLGIPGDIKATKQDGTPLSPTESALASKGTWMQVVGADAACVINGNPIVPLSPNTPLWPIAWMPVTPRAPMKIGEEWVGTFPFPLQAFFEDDKIGTYRLPVRFVFGGPDYPSTSETYGFTIKTFENLDVQVKHPEDPTLRLRGKILVDARLKIDKADGRLKTASVIMSVDLGLEGPKYPFGFSKAKASISANYERIQ
jgi:hypothetical protein